MKTARYIFLLILIFASASLTAEAQRERNSSPSRQSGPLLKTGDKAPDFELTALSGPEKKDAGTVTLKEATKDKPAVFVFSSFT